MGCCLGQQLSRLDLMTERARPVPPSSDRPGRKGSTVLIKVATGLLQRWMELLLTEASMLLQLSAADRWLSEEAVEPQMVRGLEVLREEGAATDGCGSFAATGGDKCATVRGSDEAGAGVGEGKVTAEGCAVHPDLVGPG
jgi:hypothetical protein